MGWKRVRPRGWGLSLHIYKKPKSHVWRKGVGRMQRACGSRFSAEEHAHVGMPSPRRDVDRGGGKGGARRMDWRHLWRATRTLAIVSILAANAERAERGTYASRAGMQE